MNAYLSVTSVLSFGKDVHVSVIYDWEADDVYTCGCFTVYEEGKAAHLPSSVTQAICITLARSIQWLM